MDKSKAAYSLYKEGYTLDDIASLLEVSSRSISTWKKKQDWEGQRRRETLREVNTTDMVWDLYQWNLEVLKRRVETWRAEGTEQMVDKGDVDALQKFYVQIKDRSVPWNVYVKVVRELVAYIAAKDLALAKSLQGSSLADDFLAEKRSTS